MPIHIVRLGEPRSKGEGLRIGTVRRPPRGVPKSEHASRDFYDAWLPDLAPTEDLVKVAQAAATDAEWKSFTRKYRAELARPEKKHVIELLAALSKTTAFAIGCYCADEARCHRSVLREVLAEAGATIA